MFHPEQKLVVYSWNYIYQPGRQLSCQIYAKLKLVYKLIKQIPVGNTEMLSPKWTLKRLMCTGHAVTQKAWPACPATWKVGGAKNS